MGYKERAEAAMKDGSAVNLTPDFEKLRAVGDNVTGKYLSKTVIPAKNNKPEYNQYVFDTDDGHVKFSLGSNADREIGASMEIGGIYSITFTGKESLTGGRTVNKFDVFRIPGDHLPNPAPEG